MTIPASWMLVCLLRDSHRMGILELPLHSDSYCDGEACRRNALPSPAAPTPEDTSDPGFDVHNGFVLQPFVQRQMHQHTLSALLDLGKRQFIKDPPEWTISIRLG